MYNALAYGDSDNESESDEAESTEEVVTAEIPAFEDLSSVRTDEVQVLEAVYGDDFAKETSPHGPSIIRIRVQPPDLEPDAVGSEVT